MVRPDHKGFLIHEPSSGLRDVPGPRDRRKGLAINTRGECRESVPAVIAGLPNWRPYPRHQTHQMEHHSRESHSHQCLAVSPYGVALARLRCRLHSRIAIRVLHALCPCASRKATCGDNQVSQSSVVKCSCGHPSPPLQTVALSLPRAACSSIHSCTPREARRFCQWAGDSRSPGLDWRGLSARRVLGALRE